MRNDLAIYNSAQKRMTIKEVFQTLILSIKFFHPAFQVAGDTTNPI